MSHASRPRTLDTGNLGPLQDWLAAQIGAEAVTIDKAELLAGGAIGENWRLDVSVFGSPRAGTHRWVLRTDAASPLAMSLDRAHEFACLRAAQDAGVLVPEPIADCPDGKPVGAPFMVTGHLEGYAQGFRLVRDPAIEEKGEALVETLGSQLARIHGITPRRANLEFLEVPDVSPALVQVQFMRASLDNLSEARPALEYVLCWLERNAPKPKRIVLCHSDFRTGNFMAEDGVLTGILDWEFCHWGDPHFDIGWFCARCWRFGNDAKEAGGLGSREAFYRGYNAEAETPLDESQIPYWEILSAARWATIALLQGERHISGGEASIELLLTGRMAPEMEYDALAGILSREGGTS